MRTTLRLTLACTIALISVVYLHAEEPSYTVRGLEKPAHIIVDYWGVPHIYAQTHYDAFFVQGFNSARDRLWQIDLWRRRGLGLLAQALGPDYVEQDKAARLFVYRKDMYSEWLAYGSDAKRIAQAFTSGINAYVDLLEQRPELMPLEFRLLGYEPSRWAPDDVVRIRSNGLWRNVASEVKRARIACQHGLQAASLWKVLQPDWTPTVPNGLDPCDIPAAVIDTYLLAKAPVDFTQFARATAGRDRSATIAHDAIAAAWTRELADDRGSNNWVVAPNRTATGRPILANDPHRDHAVPSLRYIAHLVAPGLNVIGAGEPALPGISIGHNDRIAFGLTIFPIDQEDLYIYERKGGGYVYRNRIEPLITVKETVRVRGGQSQSVTLEFTRHGPVVYQTRKHLFAVRAAWLEPGMAPYFGSIEYMRARNWREFRAALNRWGAPSENQVYADIDGNIGYKPAGMFPKRRNWDGLLPVPGDGRYEWDGFFDMDVLPEEYNPSRGFSGTANAMNLPADYPIDRYRIGFEWSAPWRYRRLWEVLMSQPNHDLIDSHDLQRDYRSLLAREVITRLPPAPDEAQSTSTATMSAALALLKGWDASMRVDSPAAAFFGVWFYRHLQPALAAALAPQATELIDTLDTLTVLEYLKHPIGQRVIAATLPAAYAETEKLLGADPSGWRWGDLHQIQFQHPLLSLVQSDPKTALKYPLYPRGGSANTPNNTSFRAEDFLVRSGASFRMVVDVGRWDDAEMTNAPGQSGDPRSKFYANLLRGWAEDSSFPLLYSIEAVQANKAMQINLIPANIPQEGVLQPRL
ncbi:MAG: penicillin acylase family protein [Gammaproteobacteria bacterium]|nr:penicillin acylase family protein [Gammaproteobacteria bacterium]